MENVLLYAFRQQQQPSNFFIFFPNLRFLQIKATHVQFTSHHHLRFSFITTTRSRKWDSNADSFRAQKFNFNINFDRDEDEEDDEDEEGEEDSFSGNVKKKRRWWSKKPKMKKKKSVNVLEEVIERVWIFKVFKSFGWFFPAILISFLLATGPKAFLMALAPPLLLSTLSLAFEMLRGKTQRRTKHKVRTRRKTSSRSVTGVEMGEEEEERQQTRKPKMDNQSWVASNNGPVNKGSQDAPRPSFGGWDYLDEAGSMRRTSQVVGESQKTQKGKLSGSGRKSDTPLLLRLLIAVFPFIGFWAKMFW